MFFPLRICEIPAGGIRSTAGWYEAYHGLVGELPLLGTGATNGWYGVYQQEVHCWYLHLACNQ
ncbi:unknown [Bacteroides stercoris CAG:120]|nr:unknown [Bacteroides stercoris CAG:120]